MGLVLEKTVMAGTAQAGMALLSILILFFVLSVLIYNLVDQQTLDIHRTSAFVGNLEQEQYLLNAESFAIAMLKQDRKKDLAAVNKPLMDSLSETWAAKQTLDLDGGNLRFRIWDAQGLINVNNLFIEDKLDEATLAAVKSMLATRKAMLGDKESKILLDFRKTQKIFADLDQFYNLLGIALPVRAALDGCMIALPPDTKLNVNTASLPVLQAFNTSITSGALQQLMDERRRNGQLETLPGYGRRFGLSSRFFIVQATGSYRNNTLHMKSLLFRNSKESDAINVVSRETSAFPLDAMERGLCGTGKEVK
ncbi:MAG TPA: type II secretion system protein GspK [Candidatus Acidoferrum sp.]|nr:type II secretion system protein GspK [Candidatus Acidoferrum sp.]